jgi:hypothetical protein
MGQEDIRSNRQRKRQRQKEAETAVLAANSRTPDEKVVKGFRWESAEKRLARKAQKKAQQEFINSKKNSRKAKKRAKRRVVVNIGTEEEMAPKSKSPIVGVKLAIVSSTTTKEPPAVDKDRSIEDGNSKFPDEIGKYEPKEFPVTTACFPGIDSWKTAEDLRCLVTKETQRIYFGKAFKITEWVLPFFETAKYH